MTDNPFERLAAYSSPAPDGGVILDIHALAVDLIVAAKLNHDSLEVVIENIGRLWGEIEVQNMGEH